MGKDKNRILLYILGILILLNLALAFYKPSNSKLNYRPDRFAIADTTLIDEIEIIHNDEVIKLDRLSRFKVNGVYNTDQSMLALIFAVFNRVQVGKKITKGSIAEITSDSVHYAKINLLVDGEFQSFEMYGNATRTRTFFVEGDDAYEMEIPGYRDFVGGIFLINETQWRDRMIFNGNWRSIQKLSAKYPDDPQLDFQIIFNEYFFTIDGEPELDSGIVVDFLNDFEYFTADDRISNGDQLVFDSLARMTPELVIELDDIKYPESQVFKIFPSLPGVGYRLLIDPNGEKVVFQESRIKALFRKKESFRFTPNL